MLIAMNTFQIKADYCEVFEKHWKERESRLHTVPGFLRFYLLRNNVAGDGTREYISHSLWFHQAAFESWMNGEASRRSHEGSKTLPREAFAGPPKFTSFEVIDQDRPNHRTDFRTPTLDLKVEEAFAKETDMQRELQKLNAAANLPPISVGALEGRILEVLIRSIGAKRGIEVGTLGAYSTTWLAKGLAPGGRLITIERDPRRAQVARENLARLGLDRQVELREGAASDVLATLNDEKDLDFVFIDADKQNYGKYVTWAVPRLRKGGLILADNAYIWGGMNFFGLEPKAVAYPPAGLLESFREDEFTGMSDCWRQLAYHPELASVILPTGEGLGIGVKL